jgi:hypothetical protein
MREQRLVHRLRPIGDARQRKLHLIEDVPADIDPISHFGLHQTFGRDFEGRAFGWRAARGGSRRRIPEC